MDQFLKGLLSADTLSDNLKRQLIKEKVLPKASLPIEVESCKRLFEMSWSLAVNSQKLLDKETGIKVFQAWVPSNRGTLAEWASPEQIQILLSPADSNSDKGCLFQLLMFVLDNMDPRSASYASSLTAVCQYMLPNLRGHLSLDAILAATMLLKRFPYPAPQKHSLALLQALALLEVKLPVQDLVKQKVDLLCLSLKTIITEDKSFSVVVIDLLHELLASKEKPCSFLLAAVIEILVLNEKEVEGHCLRALSMITDDDLLQLVLQRMLSWLNWPDAKNCRNWILCFLMSCNKSQRRFAVESVLASSLQEVLYALISPSTRATAHMVFQYIVLVYHQCPMVMQKVLDLTPRIMKLIQEQPIADDMGFLESLEKQLDKAKSQLDFGLNLGAVPIGSADVVSTSGGASHDFVGAQSMSASPIEAQFARCQSTHLGSGLENLGNTCYINSVVQALNMTYRFRQEVLQWSQDSRQQVLTQLQEVLAFLLLTKRPVYCPRKFIEVARPSWFLPGEQQDSQEFLNHLFDLLEEEQKATNVPVLIREVFGGTTETCITCSLCEKTSVTTDPFYSLLLPLSGIGTPVDSIALEDILSSYLKPELLEGGNKYKCDHCDRLEDARRRIRITTAPQHLILTLLRFEYESNRRKKISVPVRLPATLELPTETTASGQSAVTYFLYAAVMHSGSSAEKGHYFTYARCSASMCAPGVTEDRWCLFNDERVSRASFQSLCDVSLRSSRDTVYMLFYCRASEEMVSTNPLALVSQRLRDIILIDNYKYIKEEQQRALSKRRPPKVQDSRPRRDSDEDQPPPGTGGCGLGGGFGSFDSPSRVVF